LIPLAAAARWVWCSESPGARAARLALLPAAALYRAGTEARNAAYSIGLLRSRRLPLPSVGIGNLAVGGTGKTPLAIYVAGELAGRGLRPGILLRGYGGDELIEHRATVPEAIVEADPDRHAAAGRAAAQGAQVLVLDDCLQRRDVIVDVMLGVVSAETWRSIRWPLPAGPWREGRRALRRTDAVAVTSKLAGPDEARILAERLQGDTRSGAGVVMQMRRGPLEPLAGGPALSAESLRGQVVTALCGIGEPDLFAGQLERAGAWVELLAFPDHHAFTIPQAVAIAREAKMQNRLVVTTVKDAVKLMDLWPPEGAPCYVARLRAQPAAGAEALASLLDRVATAARANFQGAAAAPATSER